MKSRLIASLVVSAAVLVGTTGCSLITPVSTTVPYSPSDGINIPNESGPVQIRNVLIVTNEEGTEGNLVAALINTSDETQTVTLDIGDAASSNVQRLRIPAGANVSLGNEDTPPLLLTDLDTAAGATLPITFQSGTSTGATVDIPVLNGDLSYLSDLVP
ncbi:hypothetical protein FHX48_000678 [Microbacterium halimionae]|uniref:DNA modification methylase n=1 Tax=Microbacterium halimionae TaxID=1526413 RepID=A0A7W3JMN8_9MICO|nr:DNA modification methylase [Microbacterium halimionae]MBA8815626.1 hypothetical protein [Microbacterium halimionae]NII95673.1 hypothetical protein [Microbacterium halimionae]